MNILMLAQYAGSARHGMILRNYAWAREWVRQGHEVTIVTASFAHTRNQNPVTDKRIAEEMIDGIRYLFVACNRYAQSGTFGRLLAMALYTLQAWFLPLPLGAQYDLVIASSPHPFAIYPARRLARKFKAKLLYDIRDLWPLTLMQLGNISPRNPFIWLMQRAENDACRHADLVTAVPRHCETYLQAHGLRPNRFLAVGNGALPEENTTAMLPLPAEHVALLTKLRDKKAFIVGYAGAIGLANALSSAVAGLALAGSRMHLVLMGHGSHIAALQQQATTLGIANRVHFLPSVSRGQVAAFLAAIDVAFLAFQDQPLYALGVSPTKLNDYMLAAKPVLYAVNDPQNPVETSRCGIVCPAGDTAAIALAMDRLAAFDIADLTRMGQAGQDWVMTHNLVSQQVKSILEKLDTLSA